MAARHVNRIKEINEVLYVRPSTSTPSTTASTRSECVSSGKTAACTSCRADCITCCCYRRRCRAWSQTPSRLDALAELCNQAGRQAKPHATHTSTTHTCTHVARARTRDEALESHHVHTRVSTTSPAAAAPPAQQHALQASRHLLARAGSAPQCRRAIRTCSYSLERRQSPFVNRVAHCQCRA